MNWETHVKSAESMLGSSRIPASHEIISLIKRVNPTPLYLSETDRERGYRLKNELQNLLLENYGEAFHLASHPYSADIMLIKHNTLPSIDACHADVKRLSIKALDAVHILAPAPVELPAEKRDSDGKFESNAPGRCSPKEALRVAERLLDEYDYPQAEEYLTGIRIQASKDLPALIKAARLLTEEMGVYDRAIETLLSQPKHVLGDKGVRELLALTYYGNGMIPEARALLDTVHPTDLGKHALYAYADISFKDGNLLPAFNLLKLSDEKDGFVTAHASLRTDIEQCLLAQAEPWLQKAEAALARDEWVQAESLAREALTRYPSFPKARHLVETVKAEAEIARLWAQFACCESGEKKLDLLDRLLERDKTNVEKIKRLVAAEKCKQKKERMDDGLRTLRMAAAQEKWAECFDVLLWFSRQGGDTEQLRQAFQLHPYFPALYKNGKLLSLPVQTSKELWLSFVKVRSLLLSGTTEGCWDILQNLKPYFHFHPPFREEYERVSNIEKEKARGLLRNLLAELDDERDRQQAKRIVARMRRPMAALPEEECLFYRETAAELLARLEPEKSEDEIEYEYRQALYLDNAAKAASLREQFYDPDIVSRIDNEVGSILAMRAEPIPVTVSPDMNVDLGTEPASLTWMGSFDGLVMFREDDETVILVHVRRMTAVRYWSPNFENLMIMDCIPDKETFLFRDSSDRNAMWRAQLSETEGYFTARFELSEHFTFEPGSRFEGVFMSSAKDNDYYACIQESEALRFVKESVDMVSNTVRTYSIKGNGTSIHRLSYQSDGFIIGAENGTTVLDGNLATPRGCSRVGSSIEPRLFAIDKSESQTYSVSAGLVEVLDTKLRAVKQYTQSMSARYFRIYHVRGVCLATDTALVTLNPGRGFLYNLVTDEFSQQFSLSHILWTETPSSWYYFRYDRAHSTIAIKEITDDLNGIFEWQALCSPDRDDAANDASIRRLENVDFFSLPAKDAIDAEIE